MGALETRLKALEQQVQKVGNSAQYQYVSVTFPATAHADASVKHNFKGDFERIRWSIVGMELATLPADPPYVYRDAANNRKPWTRDTIFLRSNIASLTVRLLLFIEG